MQSSGTVVADSRITQVASGTGWILVALGLIVLAGWAFHVPALMGIMAGLATMKPNTAAAILLAGAALIRRNHSDFSFYSLGVLLIGTATLVEYLSNSDLGIDQLLFTDPYSTIDPGRMSQITSVGFAFLGPALLLMRARSQLGRRLSRSLGLLTGTLGFIALLGYSYDVQALYQVRPYHSVALHTALAFVIAAIGLQCVNPAEGIVRQIHSDSAGGAMLRRLLPAALLIPFLLGFTAWLGHKHLGWELGFSMALVVAATMLCLVTIMLRNARHLEGKDLALREINRTLEDRVQARTADLDSQIRERERMQAVLDAQRAQMIAASKLTSLGEMAGGLAHEINSPLNIIQARASDLQEAAEAAGLVESATVLKATGSILRTAERIMAVVRGLRTFARDGRADRFEKVSVQSILEDTLALCRERFAAHGVPLEISSVDRDLTIECQHVQISQVLLNLLNNAFDAVQALPEKWVQVRVSEEGDSINISVTDSGRGIPREIAEKAMQPFFTTKPVGKGTGLGLSISNAIVEAHHGQLRIDSRGPNTRIILSLPKRHSPTPTGGDDHERSKEQDPVVR
jgi:signal transduction histidine kinase